MTLAIERIKHLFRNKRRNIIMLVITFLVLAYFYYLTKEPVYKGKSVSEWIQEGESQFERTSLGLPHVASDATDIEKYMVKIPAYLSIRAIGIDAIPYLNKILNMPSMDWKTRICIDIKLSKHIPQFLKKMLPIPRIRSTTFIKMFPAYTLICMNMSSFEGQLQIFKALLHSHDPQLYSIAYLIIRNKTLTDEQIGKLIQNICCEYFNYREAFQLNNRRDLNETNLVKYFVPLLHHPRPGNRKYALRTLKELGSFALPILPSLMIAITNDTDRTIQQLSIQAIGAMGPSAKEAIPFLISLTNSEQSQLSMEAIKALHAIDPEHY